MSGRSAHEVDPSGPLTRAEVRTRSLAGVFFVTSSGIANLLIGFFGTLVVARLLTPADFGVVAIGATLVTLGYVVAEGGLGAGLVRRPEPPTYAELRTLNGIQLTLAFAIALPVAVVALGLGRTGAVTAIMMLSLPITTMQAPGRLVLARELRFDRQAAIDIGMQASFQGFAVVTVALGAGVWGLAVGVVVRAIVGSFLTAALSVGVIPPSLRGWRSFSETRRFGVRFQANWLALTGREQGINVLVGAVAGVSVLGLWTFTMRLVQVPLLTFGSLWTVSFPAMSNLLATGEEMGPVILRTVRRAAVAATILFPPFVAATPALVPVLFGAQWEGATRAVALVTLSTLILGSISIGTTGYLNAIGRPGVVLRATVSFGIVWLPVTAALLPVLGVTAVGVGNLCGAVVETVILDFETNRAAGVRSVRALGRPLVAAVASGSIGWVVCQAFAPSLLAGVLAGSLTLALAIAGLWLLCRDDLSDAVHLIASAATAAVSRGRKSSPGGL